MSITYLASLLFIVIGLTMTDTSQIPVSHHLLELSRTFRNHSSPEKLYETAFEGGYVLFDTVNITGSMYFIFRFSTIFVTLTIVSVCRAMLSIKSLAVTLHVDPGWLLNHAELSRVHWHQGTTEGEIVVEAFDLPVVSSPNQCKDAESTLSVDTKGANCSLRTSAVPSG